MIKEAVIIALSGLQMQAPHLEVDDRQTAIRAAAPTHQPHAHEETEILRLLSMPSSSWTEAQLLKTLVGNSRGGQIFTVDTIAVQEEHWLVFQWDLDITKRKAYPRRAVFLGLLNHQDRAMSGADFTLNGPLPVEEFEKPLPQLQQYAPWGLNGMKYLRHIPFRVFFDPAVSGTMVYADSLPFERPLSKEDVASLAGYIKRT